jgi:hypothetical protein
MPNHLVCCAPVSITHFVVGPAAVDEFDPLASVDIEVVDVDEDPARSQPRQPRAAAAQAAAAAAAPAMLRHENEFRFPNFDEEALLQEWPIFRNRLYFLIRERLDQADKVAAQGN